MIILRTTFGSNLYGTSTPSSDIDYKSIYVPDARDILLQNIKGSISQKRSKGDGEKNFAGEVEEECYSLDRFLKLVAEGQTVSLDILFSSPSAWIESNEIWHELVENRSKLLTKNSKAFIGYCRQQSAKYGIKGSRVAAARDTLAFLNHLVMIAGLHKKLGEYESKINTFVKNREFVGILEIEIRSGAKIKHLSVCDRKLPYTASIGNAINVIQLLVNEYGARALQAEKNEGIDWKALSHAVRIGEEAVELFETHRIVFPRPNADFLRDIKLGKLPYKEVAEKIENLFVEVEKASEKSDLPEKVNQEYIDNFIMKVYSNQIRNLYCPSGV